MEPWIFSKPLNFLLHTFENQEGNAGLTWLKSNEYFSNYHE